MFIEKKATPSAGDEFDLNFELLPPESRSVSLDWLVDRARKAVQDEKYDQAIPALEKMLLLGRGRTDILLFAHLHLAKIYGLFKNYRKLKKHFLSAISLEPENADLRLQLGENLALMDKPREALAAFRATIEREPNNPQFLCRY